MIFLDANYLIPSSSSPTPQAKQARAWLAAGDVLGASAMAWAEFKCGPLKPGAEQAAIALTGAPEPISVADADLAAELFNFGGRRRGSLADCIIAATAIRFGSALATENRSDFSRFSTRGLRLVP